MKPSKKERHLMYISALCKLNEFLEENYYAGICQSIDMCSYFYNLPYRTMLSYDPYYDLSIYPEIYECRSKEYIDNEDFFFPKNEEGYLNRVLILLRAIELTKS